MAQLSPTAGHRRPGACTEMVLGPREVALGDVVMGPGEVALGDMVMGPGEVVLVDMVMGPREVASYCNNTCALSSTGKLHPVP